jgi:SAM-dependent methyltransferase
VSSEIRFDNGAAYERYMGVWSRLVGNAFLDWLDAPAGLRWLDVGCGNGAFTQMLAERCRPASLDGIDPAADMLEFARTVPTLRTARLQQGSAMALPYADDSFDATVMPLVIFFVPEPAQGVAEMVRVVTAGGIVTAYSWDMLGGGFPYQAVRDELQNMGVAAPEEPSRDASRAAVMQGLWQQAGLTGVELRVFEIERTYASFEEYWNIVLGGPATSAALRAMQPAQLDELQARLRKRLPPDSAGRITCGARATGIKGRVSG